MHDSARLELKGIPTVFVASTEFIDAASVQSKALGTNPARVFVAHPIQDRTDDEIEELADFAFPQIIALLIKGDA